VHGEGGQGGSQIQPYHEKLLQQAQSGNKEAWEALCRFVYHAAREYSRTTRFPELYDPADCAQDVMVELIEQLGTIRRLRTWLTTVLVGQRAFAFRRYHHHLIERLQGGEAQFRSGSEKSSEEEESRQIARLDFYVLVNRLPDPQKDIIILHCVDGMRFKCISKLIGMQPGTVRMHYLRAKQRLQRHLNLQNGEDSDHGTDS
jgi:RNA polymerase sigma-70 factor (ECF subfamily)